MNLVEFIIVAGSMWAIVLVMEISSYYHRGPVVVQRVGGKLFSSFVLALIVHLVLFWPFYGALGYYIILNITALNTPFGNVESIILWVGWVGGGIFITICLSEGLRIRTDNTWLLHRLILEDLKKAEDPRAHLGLIIAKIQKTSENESSKRTLSVLRTISQQGNSIGGMVLNALESHGLL